MCGIRVRIPYSENMCVHNILLNYTLQFTRFSNFRVTRLVNIFPTLYFKRPTLYYYTTLYNITISKVHDNFDILCCAKGRIKYNPV